ncbi:MAG: dienelactone hydrolase family protein [Acidimicrobiales bacterium]
MNVTDEVIENGVIERRFELEVDGEVVPGIHWLPEQADGPHPTVLIGHGGTQHKRVPNILALGQRLVRDGGYGAVAIDAPGHGDRMTEADREQQRARREATADGGGRRPPMSRDAAKVLAERAPTHVAEWKAVLDELAKQPNSADGPFGYWGLSMGCAFGMPLVASEPRIAAAVLGLFGLRDGNESQLELARSVTIPVLFLFQSDDELMTRESGLALWDALGSERKTMHINPGGHIEIPRFEQQDAALAFYRAHLKE